MRSMQQPLLDDTPLRLPPSRRPSAKAVALLIFLLGALAALALVALLRPRSEPPPDLLKLSLPEVDEHGFPVMSDIAPKQQSARACWGIAAPGRIARDFTSAIVGAKAHICAVAAGSLPNRTARAAEFARTYGIPKSYGSYEALAADANVTMVYIAVTNHRHFEVAKLFLTAGKHVLLEKPGTMTATAFETLAGIAQARKLLFVTNYWTLFFPAMKWAIAVLDSGILGPVVHVAGDFAFQAVHSPDFNRDRFFNPALGGGAILDMGSYLVMFATVFLARSEVGYNLSDWTVLARGQLEGDVDTETAFIVGNKFGAHGVFGTSLKRSSDFSVQIFCTHGVLHVSSPGNAPLVVSYTAFIDADGQVKSPVPCCGMPATTHRSFERELPAMEPQFEPSSYPHAMGFVYVAAAFERCLYTPGCTELAELPLERQILIARLTETILRKVDEFPDAHDM